MRPLVLALGLTSLVAACGGIAVIDPDTAEGGSGGSGGSGASSTSGSGTSGSGTSSSGASTGTSGSGAGGGAGGAGGGTSAPISCDGDVCDGSTQVCCATMQGAKCVGQGDGCFGFEFECSSALSCGAGLVCCFDGGFNGGATCQEKCKGGGPGGPGPDGEVQLCASDAECQDGAPCVEAELGFQVCDTGTQPEPPPPPPM